ncbi:MAG: hypothetical protein KF817_04970 [Phycisphaeraceae bacterium]|nr:hypothetical protein [Phycisphaeraceae bacterium]
MIRAIASAILGYLVMAMLVVAGIGLVWVTMGPGFAFAGESTVASPVWCIVMLGFGLAAAVVGGFVAAAVGGSRRRHATNILLGIVLVLGLVTFAMQLGGEAQPLPDGRRVADLTFVEAGQLAFSPAWYNAGVIVVGLAGVWLGSRIRCGGAPARPA